MGNAEPKNSFTKKEIRIAYRWGNSTFVRRIKDIPGFYDMIKDKRVLSIPEAEMIFAKYGRPKQW